MFQELEYRVRREDNEDLFVEALLDGRQIGYAECLVDGRRIKLCDLRVHDNVRYRQSFFKRLISGSQTYTVNYRRFGLGNALLSRALAEAKALGAIEVWGVVVRKDLDATPFLIDWYKRKGFRVLAPDGECRDLLDAVHKITIAI